MTPAELAAATRRAAGLFALPQRALVAVEGEDRVRWLDGMLSCDVRALAPGPRRSGCPGLALTRKGQVVAALHVWLRADALWLETDAAALPGLLEHLRRLVVADDVRLAPRGDALLALEGPAALEVAAAAAGSWPALEPGSVGELPLGGAAVAAAAYGASGEPALRLAAPAGQRERVVAALREAGRAHGLVEGDAAAYEILRIEAGAPAFASELAGGVLPAEARLEAAIAFDKGCYTGQEIVARVGARGKIHRLLVGLRVDGEAAPEPGAALEADGERIGEVTSGCVSPACGAIALGFARPPHDAPGTPVRAGGRPARVAALPLVAPARR